MTDFNYYHLHELGFHVLETGEVYGTWAVWHFPADVRKDARHITGGFSSEEAAQAYVMNHDAATQALMDIRYTRSLEEELAAYREKLRQGQIPHYSLQQLIEFRDKPESLELAISDIQTRISFLVPDEMVQAWVQYQRGNQGSE